MRRILCNREASNSLHSWDLFCATDFPTAMSQVVYLQMCTTRSELHSGKDWTHDVMHARQIFTKWLASQTLILVPSMFFVYLFLFGGVAFPGPIPLTFTVFVCILCAMAWNTLFIPCWPWIQRQPPVFAFQVLRRQESTTSPRGVNARLHAR